MSARFLSFTSQHTSIGINIVPLRTFLKCIIWFWQRYWHKVTNTWASLLTGQRVNSCTPLVLGGIPGSFVSAVKTWWAGRQWNWVRWPRRETNDSHQSSDEVRTVWSNTSIPYTSSWRVVLTNRIHFYLSLVFVTFFRQQPTCATRLRTGRPGARIPAGARIFYLLQKKSRPALGSTQPPTP